MKMYSMHEITTVVKRGRPGEEPSYRFWRRFEGTGFYVKLLNVSVISFVVMACHNFPLMMSLIVIQRGFCMVKSRSNTKLPRISPVIERRDIKYGLLRQSGQAVPYPRASL